MCSARPERLTTSPPLGAKYFGSVCAGPCLLKVKRQRSSTFTSLLISKSYWFDKPWFVNRGKFAAIYNSAFAWGTTQLHQQSTSSLFVAPLPGTLELHQGESHTLNHFTLFLSCLLYFSFSLFFLLQKFKTPKKIYCSLYSCLVILSYHYVFY